MKKLILVSHPSITSTSHKIAEIYKNKSQKNWDTVRLHDLYKTDKQLSFLDFDKSQSNVKYREDQVLRADELVFIFPMRHIDRPAILKNWLDNVFHSGFAYNYENWAPHWLLWPRTAKIFVTCGAPSFIFKWFPLWLRMSWGKLRLGFAWIKLNKIIFVDKINKRKKDPNFQEWLEKKVR